jgi:hypothetical protein
LIDLRQLKNPGKEYLDWSKWALVLVLFLLGLLVFYVAQKLPQYRQEMKQIEQQ